MADRRANRVSIETGRYRALVTAALASPCFCAMPEYRNHEGQCISCWALATDLEYVRSVVAKPLTGCAPELAAASDAILRRQIERLEREQRLRAEQLPAAIERLRLAHEEDARG